MYFFKKSKIMMPYVIRGENMRIIGIRDNAPEEAKEAFEEYIKIVNEEQQAHCRD